MGMAEHASLVEAGGSGIQGQPGLQETLFQKKNQNPREKKETIGKTLQMAASRNSSLILKSTSEYTFLTLAQNLRVGTEAACV